MELGRPVAYGKASTCTDPEVKRFKVQVSFLFNVCIGPMASSRHHCSLAARADGRSACRLAGMFAL